MMKSLNTISRIYFLGIGGIGMSALARYFNNRGVQVSGYDKTPTPLTRLLESEGMKVHYEDDVKLLDEKADLVVYTPALPADHRELAYYREHGFDVVKRSVVLGMITKDHFNVCVAGTHGKTTTSAMIAHILRDTGFGCNAFLGGIATNYNSNFWSSKNEVCVAEADEYDRSFLQLYPDVAVITAMDADHLDIYGTEENMQEAFIGFSSHIKPGGLLIYRHALARASEFKGDRRLSYAADDSAADAYATNIHTRDGAYHFNLVLPGERINGFVLNMGGRHNIENAVAAIIVARQLGIDADKIIEAVKNFQGVKRRFEYVVKDERHIVIDDYAHHPEELRALIQGAKELYPIKTTIVFQPHLYSRTKDLAAGFAEVLSLADEAILLPIYPAREMPVPGVTSRLILDQMTTGDHKLMEKDELMQWLSHNNRGMLIISGAGDIDAMVEPIKELYKNNNSGI